MPNELLLRAKATPGSQTLGYHEPELQRWANVLPQASPIRVAPRYEAVGGANCLSDPIHRPVPVVTIAHGLSPKFVGRSYWTGIRNRSTNKYDFRR